MKLRNKKTGKVYTACCICFGESLEGLEKTNWKTLKEFCEDWEDYEPSEPLIKDKKIRKAVKAWAEVNGDTRVYYNRPTNEICVEDNKGYVIRSIKFKLEFKVTIGLESGTYSIAELCGEEEA